MLIASACPQYSRVLEFTWFGPAQMQLQILGFFAMILFGAIYEILPRVMGCGTAVPEICPSAILAFRWPAWCLFVDSAGGRRRGAGQGGLRSRRRANSG